ncbi:hypothetical protein BDZ45DRAFT_125277 [Acephala macrosclerotiorum]|nr:hypothetical protein BDZ45DRAFT_125277 [Acephala macrosclerotiorum]
MRLFATLVVSLQIHDEEVTENISNDSLGENLIFSAFTMFNIILKGLTKFHNAIKTGEAAVFYKYAMDNLELYNTSFNLEYLDKSIRLFREAVETISEADREHLTIISNLLGAALSTRFTRNGESSDLDEAILNFRKAVEFCDPSRRHIYSSNLGNWLGERYNRFGLIADFDEATAILEESIQNAPLDDPHLGELYGGRSYLFNTKYARSGDLADIDAAIASALKGWEILSKQSLDDDPDHFNTLFKAATLLGTSLGRAYLKTGDEQTLDDALSYLQQALEVLPENHPDQHVALNNLSLWQNERYQKAGDILDLKHSIQTAESALQGLPAGEDASGRAGILSNLGTWKGWEYLRTGDDTLLEKAISLVREALTLASPGDINYPTMLVNLGAWLLMRYHQLSIIDDLNGAIECSRKAIDTISPSHPSRADIANNLCIALGERYDRFKNRDELNEAILWGEEAIKNPTIGGPTLQAKYLNNLGTRLDLRYQLSLSISDLNEAVSLLGRAAEIVPSNYPQRGACYASLSQSLLHKFEVTGDMDELEQAISFAREAVQATTDGSPDSAMFLHHLADRLRVRATYTGRGEDIKDARDAYQKAFGVVGALPMVRIKAARMAGILCLAEEREVTSESAIESFNLLSNAIKLLPRISSRSLGRDDQQHVLIEASGLSSLAASAALQAGRSAAEALSILDAGRGIMAGIVINARSDLSDLQVAHPDFFARYVKLRDALAAPLPDTESFPDKIQALSTTTSISNRIKEAKDLDLLEFEIRQLPSFKHFQTPFSPHQMMQLASPAPIVAFNCTVLRSDAFIVTDQWIRSVQLPAVNEDHLEEIVKKLVSPNRKERITRGPRSTLGERNKILKQDFLSLSTCSLSKPS